VSAQSRCVKGKDGDFSHFCVFPDWKKEFHVHSDASCIALGAVLTQLGEGEIDYRIAFASQKLFKVEKNYSTTECKGLAMVYVLQKFRYYLLGANFKIQVPCQQVLGSGGPA